MKIDTSSVKMTTESETIIEEVPVMRTLTKVVPIQFRTPGFYVARRGYGWLVGDMGTISTTQRADEMIALLIALREQIAAGNVRNRPATGGPVHPTSQRSA